MVEAPLHAVDNLYQTYQSRFRGTYAHPDPVTSENLAFAHGMIAAATLLKHPLSEVVVTSHGNTLEWEVQQLLDRHLLQG